MAEGMLVNKGLKEWLQYEQTYKKSSSKRIGEVVQQMEIWPVTLLFSKELYLVTQTVWKNDERHSLWFSYDWITEIISMTMDGIYVCYGMGGA